MYSRHYKDSTTVNAPPEEVFAYVDDHARFSSHMSQSSWMMGGGKMDTQVDEGKGQTIGSHIRMGGKVFGIHLSFDEIVTERIPPNRKVWQTVGNPKLLVIGNYQMGIEVTSDNDKSQLKVFINYNMPTRNVWLGQLFGGFYAKWCVSQMISGVRDYFASEERG